MANSIVDICNSAITKLGAKRITDLEDDTPAARACDSQYNNCRQEVLRSHPWNFAIKRVELAQVSGVTPAYGYDYYYQLPSDCLRILGDENDKEMNWLTHGDGVWRVEANRRIATSLDTMKIKYVADITDVAQFDVIFSECLAFRLAADIAYALTQDRGMAGDMMQLYRQNLAHARYVDASEGTPMYDDFSLWNESRTGWRY